MGRSCNMPSQNHHGAPIRRSTDRAILANEGWEADRHAHGKEWHMTKIVDTVLVAAMLACSIPGLLDRTHASQPPQEAHSAQDERKDAAARDA